jgi:hypothetical protein
MSCKRAALLIVACFIPLILCAQPTVIDRGKVPLGVASDAASLRSTSSLVRLRAFVAPFVTNPDHYTAPELFLAAELLKQLGDYRAAELYERAIAADDSEPAYELFYADYLRNFRGPRRPLFAPAERHYLAALRKLRERQASLTGQFKPTELNDYVTLVLDRIDRGLVALYQEDGLPLIWYGGGAPALFLGSIDRLARSTSDLDEVHDTSDFTSEALFSASALRRNIALTREDLRALVRIKEPRETAERLRFRHGAWPVLDVFYRRRSIGDAQVTDFYNPRAFNDVDLSTFGVSADKTFAVSHSDWYLRAALSRLNRTGVIETLPEADETIDQLELQAAVAHFAGPDKWMLEARFTSQDIEPEIRNPPQRDRSIFGVTGEYQILRSLPFLRDPYGQLFETRGIAFSGGFANDRERFVTVDVTRHDTFAAVSVRGLGRIDVTLQPTYSDSRVSNDRSQDHAELRTDITLLVRLLDEEREPGIPRWQFLGLSPAFVHLVFPYKRDLSRRGLDALENDRVGVALNAKLFRRSLPAAAGGSGVRVRPATLLFSVRYERQRFPQLDKNLQLFALSISLGY